MNKLEITKDSLSHRLAVIGGLSEYATETDSCEYVWSMTVGAILLCVAGVVLILFATFIVHMLMGIGFSLFYGEFMFTEAGRAGIIVTAIIAGAIGIWFAAKAIVAFSDRPKKENSLTTVFRAWKNQYCIPISFKERNDDVNQTTEG